MIQRELVERATMEQSSVAGTLSAWSAKVYIGRARGADDKRKYRISISSPRRRPAVGIDPVAPRCSRVRRQPDSQKRTAATPPRARVGSTNLRKPTPPPARRGGGQPSASTP